MKLALLKLSTVPATVITRVTSSSHSPPGVSGGGEGGGGDGDGGGGDGGGGLGGGGEGGGADGGGDGGGGDGDGGGGLGDGGGGEGDGGGGEGDGGGGEGDGGGGLGGDGDGGRRSHHLVKSPEEPELRSATVTTSLSSNLVRRVGIGTKLVQGEAQLHAAMFSASPILTGVNAKRSNLLLFLPKPYILLSSQMTMVVYMPVITSTGLLRSQTPATV